MSYLLDKNIIVIALIVMTAILMIYKFYKVNYGHKGLRTERSFDVAVEILLIIFLLNML